MPAYNVTMTMDAAQAAAAMQTITGGFQSMVSAVNNMGQSLGEKLDKQAQVGLGGIKKAADSGAKSLKSMNDRSSESRDKLLKLAAASSGVMLGFSALQKNVVGVGFGLLFLGMTIPKVVLAVGALTVAIGLAYKALKGFVDLSMAAGKAGMQFEAMGQQMANWFQSAAKSQAVLQSGEQIARQFRVPLEAADQLAFKLAQLGLNQQIYQKAILNTAAATGDSITNVADRFYNITRADASNRADLIKQAGLDWGIALKNYGSSLEFAEALNARFADSAKNSSETAAAGLINLKNMWILFTRTVGAIWTAVIGPIFDLFSNFIDGMRAGFQESLDSAKATGQLTRQLDDLRAIIRSILPYLFTLGVQIGRVLYSATMLAVGALKVFFVTLRAGLRWLKEFRDQSSATGRDFKRDFLNAVTGPAVVVGVTVAAQIIVAALTPVYNIMSDIVKMDATNINFEWLSNLGDSISTFGKALSTTDIRKSIVDFFDAIGEFRAAKGVGAEIEIDGFTIEKAIGGFLGGIDPYVGKILTVGGQLRDALIDFTLDLTDRIDTEGIGKTFSKIFDSIADFDMRDAIETIYGKILELGPAIARGFNTLLDNADLAAGRMWDDILKMGDSIDKAIGPAIEDIGGAVDRFVASVVGLISDHMITGFGTDTFAPGLMRKYVKTLIGDLADAVGLGDFSDIGSGILKGIQGAFEKINFGGIGFDLKALAGVGKSIMGSIVDSIVSAPGAMDLGINKIINMFDSELGGAFDGSLFPKLTAGIRKGLGAAIEAAMDFAPGAIDVSSKISNILFKTIGTAIDLAGQAIQGGIDFGSLVVKVVNGIGDGFTKILGGVKNGLTDLLLGSVKKNVEDGVGEGLDAAGEVITERSGGLFSGIMDGLKLGFVLALLEVFTLKVVDLLPVSKKLKDSFNGILRLGFLGAGVGSAIPGVGTVLGFIIAATFGAALELAAPGSAKKVAGWIDEHIMGAVKGAFDRVKGVFNDIKDAWGIIQGGPVTKDNWNDRVSTWIDIFVTLKTTMATIISTAIEWGKNTEEFLMPKLVTLGKWIKNDLWPAIQTLGDWILHTLVPNIVEFGRQVGDFLQPRIEKLWNWFTVNLLPAFGSLWDSIKKDIIPILKDLWGFIEDPLMPAFVTLVGALGSLYLQFETYILPVIGELVIFVVGTLIPRLLDIGAVAITPLLENVLIPFATWIVNVLVWTFTNVVVPAINGLIKVIFGDGGVIDVFQKMWDKGKDFWDWLDKTFGPGISTIATTIGTAFGAIGTVVAAGFKAAAGAVLPIINGFISAYNNTIGKIPFGPGSLPPINDDWSVGEQPPPAPAYYPSTGPTSGAAPYTGGGTGSSPDYAPPSPAQGGFYNGGETGSSPGFDNGGVVPGRFGQRRIVQAVAGERFLGAPGHGRGGSSSPITLSVTVQLPDKAIVIDRDSVKGLAALLGDEVLGNAMRQLGMGRNFTFHRAG